MRVINDSKSNLRALEKLHNGKYSGTRFRVFSYNKNIRLPNILLSINIFDINGGSKIKYFQQDQFLILER